MLLNNNDTSLSATNVQSSSNNVVFRQAGRNNNKASNNGAAGSRKDNKNRGAGGSQAVRNSWSFATEQQHQQQLPLQQQPVIKESIYADPDALFNGNIGEQLKSVSRSRLRQRSVSNLTAASLAGTRSRDHSSSNRHHQGGGGGGQNGGGGGGAPGTISAKGVDYIRIHHMTTQQQQQQSGHAHAAAAIRPSVLALQHPVSDVTTTPVINNSSSTAAAAALLSPTGIQQQQQMQDRSEYGNPDGSSAHSTAEREAGSGLTSSKSADPVLLPADIYTAINQNTSNDFKMMHHHHHHQQQQQQQQQQQPETPTSSSTTTEHLIRLGSGRGSSSSSSTPTQRFPPPSSAACSSGNKPSTAEVQSRKSTVVAGPNAVKTEWTFLPSPTAAVEPQQQQHLLVHREISSKPEVCENLILFFQICWTLFSLKLCVATRCSCLCSASTRLVSKFVVLTLDFSGFSFLLLLPCGLSHSRSHMISFPFCWG